MSYVQGRTVKLREDGSVALPQESSQRFGLRTNKEDAVQRSHYFAEWERLYVTPESEQLAHKDFVIVTMRLSAIGYVSKTCGNILQRMNNTEYRWHGGLQLRETLGDGRIIYELVNFEKILWSASHEWMRFMKDSYWEKSCCF